MAWNNKGTWTWADTLYWFIYIILTSVIIMALVILPMQVLNKSVQPFLLDAALVQENLFQRASAYEYPYGTLYTGLGTELGKENVLLSHSQKKMAYKVTVRNKDTGETREYYGNKDFYDQAAPLAPLRYHQFINKRPYLTNESAYEVITDVVYPQEYDVFE